MDRFARSVKSRPPARVRRRLTWPAFAVLTSALCLGAGALAAADRVEEQFGAEIQPILEDYCASCHGNGLKKGGVSFDGLDSDRARLRDRELWWDVLRNVRAGIMPPPGKPQPSAEERTALENWVKSGAFGIDPNDPDPGRVTVRRLNRVEYRNTIRDLIGVDYDTTSEFPADDTGHGFDNIGEVLTVSPLLLEKYLAAANAIISQAVPMVPRVPPQRVIPGRGFRPAEGGAGGEGPLSLSYYEPATVSATVDAEHDGRYRLILDLTANERFVDGVNDYNRCRLVFRADGEELVRRDFVRQDGKPFRFEFDRDWKAGPHTLTLEVRPLTPDEKQVRSLALRIQSATLWGPLDERYWVRPREHARFFPGEIPKD